jgi:hypothetical protein
VVVVRAPSDCLSLSVSDAGVRLAVLSPLVAIGGLLVLFFVLHLLRVALGLKRRALCVLSLSRRLRDADLRRFGTSSATFELCMIAVLGLTFTGFATSVILVMQLTGGAPPPELWLAVFAPLWVLATVGAVVLAIKATQTAMPARVLVWAGTAGCGLLLIELVLVPLKIAGVLCLPPRALIVLISFAVCVGAISAGWSLVFIPLWLLDIGVPVTAMSVYWRNRLFTRSRHTLGVVMAISLLCWTFCLTTITEVRHACAEL